VKSLGNGSAPSSTAGGSPPRASRFSMPVARYPSMMSTIWLREWATHVRCGMTVIDVAVWMCSTIRRVVSRVEPRAP
jgi:hypothetical protein